LVAFEIQAHGAFSLTHTFQYGQTHTNNKTHHVNQIQKENDAQNGLGDIYKDTHRSFPFSQCNPTNSRKKSSILYGSSGVQEYLCPWGLL